MTTLSENQADQLNDMIVKFATAIQQTDAGRKLSFEQCLTLALALP